MQSEKSSMFGLFPHNLCAYGNEAVAVPHPPLRGTFPPGEGISQTLRLSNTNFTLCFLFVPKGLLNCQLSIRFLYVGYMTAFQNICAPLCVWAKRRVGLLFGIYLADDGENIVDVVHHDHSPGEALQLLVEGAESLGIGLKLGLGDH